MGEQIRPGTEIRDFTPDDDDTTLWVEAHYGNLSMTELMKKILDKWPDADFEQVTIEAVHAHTHCLGYDRYDPGDHTNYLKITLNK